MLVFVAFGLLFAQTDEIARLESEVRQSPSDAAAWKRLGLATAASRKLGAAAPAFQKACELNPADEDACYYLARTLNALGRWDEARAPFEKALQAAPKAALARVHRAVALNFVALGQTADAEDHFRKALALNPGPDKLPEDPRVDYGAFLFRQGRTDEALRLLQQAVRGAPRSARAHGELGRVLLHSGKAQAAVTSLEMAIELDPRASATRLLLGRAYLQTGRVEDGQRQLQLAQEALDGGSSSAK
jgi:protein O-GlcNAc transferase